MFLSHIDVSLSFSLPSPFSKNKMLKKKSNEKKMSLGEDKKNKINK